MTYPGPPPTTRLGRHVPAGVSEAIIKAEALQQVDSKAGPTIMTSYALSIRCNAVSGRLCQVTCCAPGTITKS